MSDEEWAIQFVAIMSNATDRGISILLKHVEDAETKQELRQNINNLAYICHETVRVMRGSSK